MCCDAADSAARRNAQTWAGDSLSYMLVHDAANSGLHTTDEAMQFLPESIVTRSTRSSRWYKAPMSTDSTHHCFLHIRYWLMLAPR